MLDRSLSVQDAADYSGYNVQYLRRLVQAGTIAGRKIGQVWLVQLASLDTYLKSVQRTDDRRFGPRVYQGYINERQCSLVDWGRSARFQAAW